MKISSVFALFILESLKLDFLDLILMVFGVFFFNFSCFSTNFTIWVKVSGLTPHRRLNSSGLSFLAMEEFKEYLKITESDFSEYLENLEDYEERLARSEIQW
ncbi:MAG: hypothetical protein QNJ32_27125 [Xenococcaceae cyanobacterium MO_167.B27]|nr:hypothetical protein [Xenococcaceae cyanobacterium MO_167.B27]